MTKHIRDAETGQYISLKDTKGKDPSTWIKETDFDKGAFLEEIFELLVLKTFNNIELNKIIRLEDIEKVFSQYGAEINMNNTFNNKLNTLLKDLFYISETDAPMIPIMGGQTENTNIETLLYQITEDPNIKVEEIDLDEIFKGQEDKEKFNQLKELLEHYLTDLRIYKIGEIQIDIYIVGIDTEGNLRGIKTKSVET